MTLRKNIARNKSFEAQNGLFNITDKIPIKNNQDSLVNLFELDQQELINIIEEKDRQNKQLIRMLFKYKEKIVQFQKYQEIISELRQKNQLNSQSKQNRNVKKMVLNTEDQTQKQLKKVKKKQCFQSASFSIMIYSEKVQNLFRQEKQNILFSCKQKIFPSPSNLNFLTQTQCSNNENSRAITQRGASSNSVFYKKNKPKVVLENSCSKLNMTFDQTQNQISRQTTGRVPSLDNLRRIKNCYKLLKKSDQLLGHRYQNSGF